MARNCSVHDASTAPLIAEVSIPQKTETPRAWSASRVRSRRGLAELAWVRGRGSRGARLG